MNGIVLAYPDGYTAVVMGHHVHFRADEVPSMDGPRYVCNVAHGAGSITNAGKVSPDRDAVLALCKAAAVAYATGAGGVFGDPVPEPQQSFKAEPAPRSVDVGDRVEWFTEAAKPKGVVTGVNGRLAVVAWEPEWCRRIAPVVPASDLRKLGQSTEQRWGHPFHVGDKVRTAGEDDIGVVTMTCQGEVDVVWPGGTRVNYSGPANLALLKGAPA